MKSGDSSPELAIIIPVFRHSVLLVDAIESALNQDADFQIKIIIVNDGCPHQETEDVCLEYSTAYPHQIVYLKKANGGLSDARNFGIRYTLESFPTVTALYMLDADNRLQKNSMARAMKILREDESISWIFPNIDMFGMDWSGDFGGDYSLLIHSAMNICEAGSLIHRRVFDCGIYFDTNFRQGWEDWDFFLSMAEAGFRGRNLEHFGFLYRKRPESMLADSNRVSHAIESVLQQKHKSLFQPKRRTALEHVECPRYAIFLPDRAKIILAVDPVSSSVSEVSLEDFIKQYWSARISPGRYFSPPILVVLSSATFEDLKFHGMLHWALMRLERGSKQHRVSILKMSAGTGGRCAFHEIDGGKGRHRDAEAVCIASDLLNAIMDDHESGWIDSVILHNCQPEIFLTEIQIEGELDAHGSPSKRGALVDFLWMVHRIRESPYRDAAKHGWEWRENGITLRNHTASIVRKPFAYEPPMPHVADERRHIGFLLPLIEFGGVEKVALNMARALSKRGFACHAIVLGRNDCAWSAEWRETFESLTFLGDPGFSLWGGEREYLGTSVPWWTSSGNHGLALATLYWLDIVINFHGGAIAGIMGQLRRLGVKTATSLHLVETSEMNRSNGNAHLSLAFEHAYDYFLPCSYRLGSWLHGMGVPQGKIFPVQNAPGFATSGTYLKDQFRRRQERPDQTPLRVLFLGRLDRQKGIDRLAEVMRRAERQRLEIEWRIVGKAIVESEAVAIPPEIAEAIEPAVAKPADLDKLYAWADVLILLSGFEGLPLTVLEAMRAGVVVVATDVGAVGEVVESGHNGILVSLKNAVSEAMGALHRLSTDRSLLRSLSRTAYGERNDHSWDRAIAPFADHLENAFARAEEAEALSLKQGDMLAS